MLLVRVAAIVATLLSFGIAIVLYLVLWTVLPVKAGEGAIIDVKPQKVSSEHYARVVQEELADSAQEHSEPEEEESPLRDLPSAARNRLAVYRFSLAFFALFVFAITLVIFAIARTSGIEGFVALLPLYFIPVGIFLAALPRPSRSLAVRICIMLLCFEMAAACLPFTLGLIGYGDMGLLEGSTFLTWVVALIFLVAAVIFENTTCYLLTVVLVFMAIVVSGYDFGFFSSSVALSSFKG